MKYSIGLSLLALLVGFSVGAYTGSQDTIVSSPAPEPVTFAPLDIPLSNASTASLFIPAVDQQGRGVNTQLLVQIVPGAGRSLANINSILFLTDTQNSIRIAKAVAEEKTNISLANYDVIYTITADAAIIEGPSAGAAVVIATIAAIEHQSINQQVMITGTINPDGTIGAVGGVEEKARAAQDIGAATFLVPRGQGTRVTYTTTRVCETFGATEVCTVEQVPETVTPLDVGIDIVEVSTVDEALEYFL